MAILPFRDAVRPSSRKMGAQLCFLRGIDFWAKCSVPSLGYFTENYSLLASLPARSFHCGAETSRSSCPSARRNVIQLMCPLIIKRYNGEIIRCYRVLRSDRRRRVYPPLRLEFSFSLCDFYHATNIYQSLDKIDFAWGSAVGITPT